MLKKLKIHNKDIPVPVPLHTLGQAFDWVQKTFTKKTHVVTGFKWNASDLLVDLEQSRFRDKVLGETDTLEVQIDNPKDLSLQTIEAVRELAFHMERRLPKWAVASWQQTNATSTSLEVKEILSDVSLMLELIDHINGMLDYSHEDMAPLNGLACLVTRGFHRLTEASKTNDHVKSAILMIHRMAPLLKELVQETERLQLKILMVGLQEFDEVLQAG